MKKTLFICLLLIIVFLTGCEKNRLVCTYNENDIQNLESKTKYVFIFNDESIKKATMTTEVTLLGDYNEDVFIQNYTEMASASASNYNLTEGVTATVKNKKNVVTLKVEMEPNQMLEEDIEIYGLNLSKDNLLTEFENMGYTCK